MSTNQRTVALGFTPQAFPAGAHVCQIVGSDEERLNAQVEFLVAGLRSGERVACFSDHVTHEAMAGLLSRRGIDVGAACDHGGLTVSGTRQVYFPDDDFDPERMLALLASYHEEAITGGFSGARVIGEMAPDVRRVRGGDRLLEYEARVSLLLRERPVTAVCQYDARAFDGAAIMEILGVHPLMVVRGSIVHNPFFAPPEDILARLAPRA